MTVESGHENKSWQFSSGSNGENSESDDERGLLMNHETSGTKSSQLLEQCRLCLLQSLSLRAEILRQFGYYKVTDICVICFQNILL